MSYAAAQQSELARDYARRLIAAERGEQVTGMRKFALPGCPCGVCGRREECCVCEPKEAKSAEDDS
jgi:hypothetical protein